MKAQMIGVKIIDWQNPLLKLPSIFVPAAANHWQKGQPCIER